MSPSPAPSDLIGPIHGSTWAETTFTPSKTFADYLNAGYPADALLKSD